MISVPISREYWETYCITGIIVYYKRRNDPIARYECLSIVSRSGKPIFSNMKDLSALTYSKGLSQLLGFLRAFTREREELNLMIYSTV